MGGDASAHPDHRVMPRLTHVNDCTKQAEVLLIGSRAANRRVRAS
jgi:hypothetical protein